MGKVEFDTIKIIEFAPGIGDSPFVNGGVPLALGDVIGERTISVRSYEKHRRKHRRSGQALVLKKETRYGIVRSEGYREEDILDAAKKAYNSRKSIAESIGHRHWDKFNERVEATRRRLSKMVGLRRSKSFNYPLENNFGNDSRTVERSQSEDLTVAPSVTKSSLSKPLTSAMA